MVPAQDDPATARILVGTSGYNYPEWKGAFYPEGLSTAKMLPYYAERFPTVEINYTFYRLPNAKTVAGWTAATPDRFTFALKASQRITHFQRLREVEEPVRYFCDTARLLAGKLGPLLFQLPPNFKKDTERLGGVLALLPLDLRVAFEFRHPSWFDEEVYGLLRAAERRAVHRRPRRRRYPGGGHRRLGLFSPPRRRVLAGGARALGGDDPRALRRRGRLRLFQARGRRHRPAPGPEAHRAAGLAGRR